MKSSVTHFALAFVLLATLAGAAQAAEPAGRWEGAIRLPGGKLDIVVTIDPKSDDGWKGTIDIPAQGLRGFELSGIAVDGVQVRFEMAGIPGEPRFDGKLSESGDSIAGTFHQGPQTLPFSLKRSGAAPAAPSAPVDEPVPGDGAAGEWLGTIDAGAVKLRLALEVKETGDGLALILDSVDQGSKVPADEVVFEERTLRFAIKAAGATYEGTLNGDGSALEGTWRQGGREIPLTFRRLKQSFALNRPQLPKGPFPYAAHEVAFQSKAGDVRLAGTLVLPSGDGPFPAVVMVTGSGAQDRDESLMGHKPFLVIADALARKGIASLRYDDRGAGKSGGDHIESTVDDFAADARAAIDLLRSRPEIDGSGIGILGHSEGGLTGPMIAAGDEKVAFLVLLAPPGEPMRSLMTRQASDYYRLLNLDEDLIERAVTMQASDLELIADASLTTDQLRQKLRALIEVRRKEFTEAERALLQIDSDAIERGIQMSTTPWFRSLMRQDPAAHLRRAKVPVLALFGEKDFQVHPEVNAAAVRKALSAAGNKDFEVEIYPRLNHLFQHAETGGIEEYGTIEETFAPVALDRISNWIAARFSRSSE